MAICACRTTPARPLGLSDLRLAASHHDGVWRFAQGVAGQQLGNFVATQSLSSPGPWPDAHSALDGVLQAQVDRLSRWGSWLPAGWRLGAASTAWRGSAAGSAPRLDGPGRR